VSRLAAIRRGRAVRAKISEGRGRPWGKFFGFYKTRHILLSERANCTVLRAVVLTQYRRVTDRQTDGIAIASTALAKRRAVKIKEVLFVYSTSLSAVHPYGAQVWHVLMRDHTVLPATHTFIQKWNEPYLLYFLTTARHHTLAGTHFPSR